MKLFFKFKLRWVFIFIALFIIIPYFAMSVRTNYERDEDMSKLTIIGHRGAAGLAPENTLLSIKKALDQGVDVIEIDVQRSKDSTVVVLHDKSIDRTTTGEGDVDQLTYSEIKTHAIVEEEKEFSDLFVPTLNDVLKLIDGRTKLIIEIKNGSDVFPHIEQQVIDEIHANNASEWCIIQSFEDIVLENTHRIDPDIEIHKLFFGNFLGIGLKRKALEEYPYVSAFNTFYRLTSKSFIDEAHRMGKKVNVWTVNDSEVMQKMIDKGVDGIITDRPDLLKELN